MIGLMAIIGLIVFSCKKSGSDTGTSPVKIIMHNITFSPASVMVNKGTAVKWQNDDDYAHNVNSNDSITFSSGIINGGGSFSYTATVEGAFDYRCLIHGLPMLAPLAACQLSCCLQFIKLLLTGTDAD